MDASMPTKPTVGLISWQIDEDGIDIRPGDFVSWVVLTVPLGYFAFSDEDRPVRYLFDTSGLTQANEVGGRFEYVQLEGIVETIEAVNRPETTPAGRRPRTRAVGSTSRATANTADGAIVTFAAGANVQPSTAAADTGEVEVRRESQ